MTIELKAQEVASFVGVTTPSVALTEKNFTKASDLVRCFGQSLQLDNGAKLEADGGRYLQLTVEISEGSFGLGATKKNGDFRAVVLLHPEKGSIVLDSTGAKAWSQPKTKSDPKVGRVLVEPTEVADCLAKMEQVLSSQRKAVSS